jgi:chromosome partitioning protein
MIISLINQKGGVGKTTLSLNIAHAFALDNKKVLLVDADTQQSALTWSEKRSSNLPFHVFALPTKTINREIQSFVKNYDFIIIDTSPRVTSVTESCVLASDLAIIPCQPSPYDVWASEESVKLVNKVKSVYKDNLKATFAINRKIVNTSIGRDVSEALTHMGVSVFKTTISQRVLFAEAAVNGMTVYDLEPEGKAAQEISKLVDEIKRTM